MEASQLLLSFAAPSLCLEKRDLDKVHKLAAILVFFLAARARRFILQRLHQPLLVQYSSDVTPLTTRERFKQAFQGLHVERSGRQLKEFLIQRCFVADAQGLSVSILDRPSTMEDKTAMTHWNASARFMEHPFNLGHHSVLVLHHVYDRALMSAMRRVQGQYLQMLLDKHHEDAGDVQGYQKWLCTWYSVVGCFCHDCHGGLKWSVLSYVKDPLVMRGAFVSIASCRNAFDLLVRHAGGWIAHRICILLWGLVRIGFL